jgi:hypothetical protein
VARIGHVLGEVDWHFALANNLTSFIGAGQTLTLTYHVAVKLLDRRSASNSFIATWDGAQIVGDSVNLDTILQFTYDDDGTAM